MSLYPRERISEALQESANRGIAMVIAPAGFGKTEAVGDAFGPNAHWVRVPEHGASLEALARDIIAAAEPESARSLAALLTRAPDAENRAHLTGWVAARLRTVEAPIVLDDFQHTSPDESAVAFVRDVIAATIPAVRWVLVSRETPELPIGTWLARDYMTLPITTDDLAFDVEEATGVARAMDVEIGDDALGELVRDVSGWPLAVRLTLGAWERTRSLPPLRIRTRSVLFDFLETEVWSRLAETEREFFEAAAYLTELRPRVLSAAGFPESRLSLEHLQRRIPLLSKLNTGTFRLHELFREFILQRAVADAASRAELIKRLAHALERFGSFEEAVAMLVRADDWAGTIGLLARRGVDRIESGHRSEVTVALAALPRAYRDHPVVTGLRGYALALDGAYELAKREIEASLAGAIDASLRGPLTLQCASLAFNIRDLPAAARLNRSVMGDESFSDEVRMKAAASLAMVCALAGEREGARDAMVFCASGLESGSVEVRAHVRHRLAYAHLCLGEYALSEQYATECVQLAHAVGLEALAARAYTILQNVAVATFADVPLVRRYVELCLHAAEASGDRAMQIFALESLVYLACGQGDDELFEARSPQLRALRGSAPPNNVVWVRFHHAMREAGLGRRGLALGELMRLERASLTKPATAFVDALTAILVAASDYERARHLLERPVLLSAEGDVESMRFLAYAQAFHALGHWLIGHGRAARRARMPNTGDLSPADAAVVSVIGTICSTSRQTITSRQLEQFTEPLNAIGLSGYSRFLRVVLAPASVHALTRTELEVLRELRTGGTTAEVAERLGKSSNTVLSHIKAACSKIGCSGRLAAVAYAVDQGWID
jgi:ATP/maltotriose-dependent transcriptional regulator MalT